MILDQIQPRWDARRADSRILHAARDEVYRAVLATDFLDAVRRNLVVKLLFALRTGIERTVSAVLRRPWIPLPELIAMRLADNPPHGDWVKLGENPPYEIAFGAIGRFWAGQTVWRQIDGAAFAGFAAPGYAKIACNLSVAPLAGGSIRLTYEVRTLATDPGSRRAFLRYWRFVSPMVGTVMRSLLSAIARTIAAAQQSDPLFDQFVPVYDVCERHSIAVAAPAAVTFAAAKEMSLEQSWIVRAILRAREILLGSRRTDRLPPQGILAMTESIGWGHLAVIPGHEIVMGAITRPWEPDVVFRPVPPDQFAAYTEPGHVKIAWTLRADKTGEGTSVFRTETRVTPCDEEARRLFRRYWRKVSPGILLIRLAMLRPLKKEAERRARASFGRAAWSS